MKLYTQTDPRWSRNFMTSPLDFPYMQESEKKRRWDIHSNGMRGDTIGRFGCLKTSLGNARNIFDGDFLRTPEHYNELLRENNGYWALDDINKCKIGQEESFIDQNKHVGIGDEFEQREAEFLVYLYDKYSFDLCGNLMCGKAINTSLKKCPCCGEEFTEYVSPLDR